MPSSKLLKIVDLKDKQVEEAKAQATKAVELAGLAGFQLVFSS